MNTQEEKKVQLEILERFKDETCSIIQARVDQFIKDNNLKPSIEVGKCYKDINDKYLVLITDEKNRQYSRYGFNADGDWSVVKLEYIRENLLTEATKEEWTQRILDYAEKKYPKGTKIDNSNLNYDDEGIGNIVCSKPEHEYSDNTIWIECDDSYADSRCIFTNGIWAEIIEEKTIEERLTILEQIIKTK